MKQKIIIVGTLHSLQRGEKESHSGEHIEDFKKFISKLCSKNKVQFIAEEINQESIASKLAEQLSIKYQIVDMPQRERCLFNISDIDFTTFAMRMKKAEHQNGFRDLLCRHLSNPVREVYFLTKILKECSWPTLLICGADHAPKVQSLVNSICLDALHTWYNCCPGEEGSIIF